MVYQMFEHPTGSTIGNLSHMGPRQAGNKSLLSYRPDIGVPGYTGFIPADSGIPLQAKVAEHTGIVASEAHRQAALNESSALHTTSWYRRQFQADPADYCRPDRNGGGYWFRQRPPAPGRPFTAGTTYQAELLAGGPTAEQQLARTVGLRATLGPYEGARRGLETGTLHRATAPTAANGLVLGFTTTYGSMRVEDSPLARSQRMGGSASPSDSTASDVSEAGMVQMVPGRLEASFATESTYTGDYGTFNSDPLDHRVAAADDMTTTATTLPINVGTARATEHPPGYTGFVPDSPHNVLACHQAAARQTRRSVEADSMLRTMDQYSRQRVPHYTGHKAQHAGYVRVEPPRPSTLTTQGHAHALATQRPVTVSSSSAFINSRKGTMAFFNEGSSAYSSENGLAEAQKAKPVPAPPPTWSRPCCSSTWPGDGAAASCLPPAALQSQLQQP